MWVFRATSLEDISSVPPLLPLACTALSALLHSTPHDVHGHLSNNAPGPCGSGKLLPSRTTLRHTNSTPASSLRAYVLGAVIKSRFPAKAAIPLDSDVVRNAFSNNLKMGALRGELNLRRIMVHADMFGFTLSA